MKTKLFGVFFLFISFGSHAQKTYQLFETINQPKSIIFETDIGNDVDDALALDMLYKYLDEKKIAVLAISSNKESKYSTEYINLMNC